MKKAWLFLLVFCLFLAGCSGKKPARTTLCRIATRIEVQRSTPEETYRFGYTEDDKIESVLLYLRCLDTWGFAQEAERPQELWQIQVELSDGSKHIYRQADDRYFQINGSAWLIADQQVASRFHKLIALLPADEML